MELEHDEDWARNQTFGSGMSSVRPTSGDFHAVEGIPSWWHDNVVEIETNAAGDAVFQKTVIEWGGNGVSTTTHRELKSSRKPWSPTSMYKPDEE
jgi:hypothetical protein